MAGKDSDGLVARGSKWGMKRMEGRFGFDADAASGVEALAEFAGVDGFRTDSTGAAVSARLRVMLRAPVEFAVVVMLTAGAVVEDVVSAAVEPLT